MTVDPVLLADPEPDVGIPDLRARTFSTGDLGGQRW